MRLVCIVVCIVATATVCRADVQSGKLRPDDYPFQCGAVFGIIGRAYSDAANVSEATKFSERAKKLELLAQAEFARRGRTQQDAENYMQKHIDLTIELAAREPQLIANFVRACEQRFPG